MSARFILETRVGIVAILDTEHAFHAARHGKHCYSGLGADDPDVAAWWYGSYGPKGWQVGLVDRIKARVICWFMNRHSRRSKLL